MVAPDNLHEAGIDALSKARVMLDCRAIGLHGGRVGIGDQLHRVRIAHRHRRNPDLPAVDIQRPHAILTLGPGLQAAGVKRDLQRIQDGRAHVDRDAAVGFQRRLDHTLHGFNLDRAFRGQAFVGNEFDEGACAIAALLDFATIRVIDAVAKIDAGCLRSFDHQYLVGADAETAIGQQLPLRGREIDVLVDRVDHDKIVAGAVHFREFEFHPAIIDRPGRASPAAKAYSARPRRTRLVRRAGAS